MDLKIYFTKNQLLKNYMNIGASYASLNRNNSYYLLGIYNNFSLINLNIFIFKLKKSIAYLLGVFLKNNLLNVMVINTSNNKILNKIYSKIYLKIRISYFIGTWWNGLLKNFKKYIKYANKKKRQYVLFKNLLPFTAFYINQEKYYKKDLGSYNFHNETNSASIFSLIFTSTSVNSYKAPSILFQNTRNLINNFFLSNFCVEIARKILFSLKKKFCFFIFKNFKIFSFKNKILINFFENFFLSMYKKKFFKNIKWGGDLK